MAKVVLTMVDTAGIQGYIFGSNRLRENIGASYLVKQATSDWVYETLVKLNNLTDKKTCKIDSNKHIVTDDLAAELIYTGGGNAVILFRSMDEARTFARRLSRKALDEAPGLEIIIAHSEPFDWSPAANDLRDEVRKLREGRLADKKHTGEATLTPLLGLGVTAECAATGLVAAHRIKDPEERFVSDEIYYKSQASEIAKKRLKDEFAKADPRFDFSNELDHLSRTGGEESYIAIVHIDGNDVGSRFSKCGSDATDNWDYINRLRKLSDGIEKASNTAIVRMLQQLARHIPEPEKIDGENIWKLNEAVPEFVPEEQRVETQRKQIILYRQDKEKHANPKPCWPVIPLVYGGDDLTFVCNGQLGLSLATICMKAFTRETEKLLDKPIHTGAGICIVKVHYPFRRAYELSETLTTGAKKMLGVGRPNASALDWHISTTGLSGSLSAIREREYTAREGSLLMRPVRLAHATDWRTWENFNRLIGEFNFARQWAGRRNKLKALREALRAGPSAVEEFLKTYFQNDKLSLPELGTVWPMLPEKGWEGDRCGYFDALEAMDHHFLLEELSDDSAN